MILIIRAEISKGGRQFIDRPFPQIHHRKLLCILEKFKIFCLKSSGVSIIEQSQAVPQGPRDRDEFGVFGLLFLWKGPCKQAMRKKKVRSSVVCWWLMTFFFCFPQFFRHQFPNYKFISKKKKQNYNNFFSA